jgi:hypothetical protein
MNCARCGIEFDDAETALCGHCECDDRNTARRALAAPSGSETEMAAMLARWRDRILKSVGTAIDNHYLDGPVEDQTDEERGFERGLGTAITEVCKLMDDPSYFGRQPQNAADQRPGTRDASANQ